ncbi:MAG: IS481 family transposase, partial [Kiritimatiellae bacterium]|nr:IS481 family transposase [Kiritimatiellia bacterium]
MSDTDSVDRPADRWATFCLAVVGPLLANPPGPGELHTRLVEMASQSYQHPITGQPCTFGLSTIERWYYKVRKKQARAVEALHRAVRKDAGTQPSLSTDVRTLIQQQYRDHPRWSYQLHWDNLKARAKNNPKLGEIPSYPTVRRYMRSVGLFKKKRRRRPDTPGARQAEARLEQCETRSFESATVNGLWHLDFHEGSRLVLLPNGELSTVDCFGMLDDRSRVACHVQWYPQEETETLVHGVSQGLQKRGRPWSLMSDCGGAMNGEYLAGLERLGINVDKTLPYSPHQNGKQEAFWGQIEGRLMAMLENHRDLTLDFLNEATQAWVEYEYNRKFHSELGCTPLERFLEGPYVGRECPPSDELRRAFRIERRRTQRRSDGTICLEGRRFEVPSRFRHVQRIHVRYARWDLTAVDMVDERTGAVIAPLYRQDKVANADGERKTMEPLPDATLAAADEPPSDGIAP